MKSRDIRETFLSFFEKKGHKRVPSSPLIPAQDPTLLFTNAGMNQFKDVFLGLEKRSYTRAVSCQKCMRAGGKHNDLENVGFTPRHHTFFEMLGNFSFGDYFKREAIVWAWELITEVYKLSVDRLWVTIYEKDDEAWEIWVNDVGIADERVVRLGEKDNFWEMGDTGPCGPCSEIYYDFGESYGCGKETCGPGCECGRFLEFWNLVFMQYNRDAEGHLTPLPKPSIDTGMGIERIASILQGVYDNYHTDLFEPIIATICDRLQVEYRTSEPSHRAVRVIADHARAVAFLLAEGILPSNEGRGYVLRKIIRRALRFGQKLGAQQPFLHQISLHVVDLMKDVYPELEMARELIRNGCYAEEERFYRVIETGLHKLHDLMHQHREDRHLPGEDVFRLYDSYGLPLDFIEEIAREESYTIDYKGYERALEEQRERARSAWKGEEEFEGKEVYRQLAQRFTVRFHGYDHLTWEDAEVVALLNEKNEEVQELNEGERGKVILNETVFYGESGGQVGDQGVFHSEHAHCLVYDTKIYFHTLIVHHVEVREGVLRVGDKVAMEVPKEQRWATMRHHTGTHLLHAALREILGVHVKQAGSLVAPDRLRFDFTHFRALSREELEALEQRVNAQIMENKPVEIMFMNIDEALESGALAFFGDKYPDRVRVIQVGDFSKELCGGTHVRQTGDIGLFLIVKEGSIASGVRRIEAVCGEKALEYLQKRRRILLESSEILQVSEQDLPQKIELLQERTRELEKMYRDLRIRYLRAGGGTVWSREEEFNGYRVVEKLFEDVEMEELRSLADTYRSQPGTIVVLGAKSGKKAFLVVGIHPELKKLVNAGDMIRQLAPRIGGGGGGRPDFAQAGGSKPEHLVETLEYAYSLLKDKMMTVSHV